jgi:hypothetical protein
MLQKGSGRVKNPPERHPYQLGCQAGRVEEGAGIHSGRGDQHARTTVYAWYYGGVTVLLLLAEPRQCILEVLSAICFALRIVVLAT